MPGTANNRKRQLGLLLAQLRRAADKSGADAARHMGVAPPTVHRWERGENSPTQDQLDTLLTFYNATTQQKDTALTRLADVRQPSARVEHAAAVPRRFRAFLRSEADAVRERATSLTIINGLLQTEAYARAVTAGTGTAADRLVASRIARQGRLTADAPLRVHVVMEEATLRRVVGSKGVMAEQLAHLMWLGELDTVTIQIVAFDTPRLVPAVGPITILDYPAPTPSSVYLEQITGSVWVDKGAEKLTTVFEEAASAALDPQQSRRLMAAVMKEMTE